MANVHVNNSGGSSSTIPYETWAKAASTMNLAATQAAAGDDVWVHPSHNETAATNLTWAGTTTNPVKIVCGTPDATSGITALQNTAIWGINAASSSQGWSGAFYVRGISFRLIGSSGTASLSLNSTSTATSTIEDCQFYATGAGGTSFVLGSATAPNVTNILNCSYRLGQVAHMMRLNGRMTIKGLTALSGSSAVTAVFNIGNATNEIYSIVEVDGLDMSVHANTIKLTNTFAKPGKVSVRNVKVPTGWGVAGGTIATGDLSLGSELELLNYGDGDTNYRYWTENRFGRAMDDTTIKITGALVSGNNTATYSKRLQTTANAFYPNAIYRGPSIAKYVDPNGQYKGIFVYVCFDGSTPFTNKEFWVEVSFRGTSGFSNSTIATSCPSYITAATALTSAGLIWEGFTNGVTVGPNGSNGWYTRYAYVGGLALMESGWMTVTPCFAVPSKTIFMNDDFTILDEGSIA